VKKKLLFLRRLSHASAGFNTDDTCRVCIFFGFSATTIAQQKCDSIIKEDLMSCTNSAFIKSDQVLNEQYNILMIEIPAGKKSELKSAQLAWITFKENTCEVAYDSTSPGLEAPIEKLACLSELSSARLDELIYLRTGVVNDGFYKAVSIFKSKYPSKNFRDSASEMVGDTELSRAWEDYSEKHCGMAVELYGEDPDLCLLRMRFQVP
jgi:uncharacterized protein YecT (DUF1311 family)